MPLDTPAPALVPPSEFAGAVSSALVKVLSMSIDRSAIASTVEEVRTVAKEARAVVEEAYSAEELDAFTEVLTPVFERARSI
jgi:predicted lipid-binding transport protein (Tim44 family)